jgi:hypothetical protein
MNLAAIAFAAQTATVHFVGITLFIVPPPSVISGVRLGQESPSSEFVAIMPNIPSHILLAENPTTTAALAAPGHKVTTSRSAVTGEPVRANGMPLNGDVEHHEAFLIFQEQDLLDVNGWEVKRLESHYLAIPLHGEHLTFVSDAPNPPVNATLPLRHLTDPMNPTPLRPEYMPPAYSDAAAVFEMPNGTLKVCSKDPKAGARIDVEATLKNNGTFTIRAGNKSLTVAGSAIVVAAHAPFEYVNNHEVHATGMPHNIVYCRMLVSGNCSTAIRSLTIDSAGPGPCKDPSIFITGTERRIVPPVPPDINQLADFACSTTQWP